VTGEFGSLYRGSFPYITLLLGWKISFVIPRSSLCRGSLNRGSTVSTSWVKSRKKISKRVLRSACTRWSREISGKLKRLMCAFQIYTFSRKWNWVCIRILERKIANSFYSFHKVTDRCVYAVWFIETTKFYEAESDKGMILIWAQYQWLYGTYVCGLWQTKKSQLFSTVREQYHARLKRTNSLSLLVNLFYIFIDINRNVHASTILTSLAWFSMRDLSKKATFYKRTIFLSFKLVIIVLIVQYQPQCVNF